MIKEPSCADDHDPEALTVDAARLRVLDSILPMSLTERVPVRPLGRAVVPFHSGCV